MKLEIDTHKDSELHIRQAIRLLQSLIEGKESFTNETGSGQQSTGLMNMFGESSTPAESPAQSDADMTENYGDASFDGGEEAAGTKQPLEDQSGFTEYGSHEPVPRQPEKEEAPPGSLFGMFKDATGKLRNNKIIPY